MNIPLKMTTEIKTSGNAAHCDLIRNVGKPDVCPRTSGTEFPMRVPNRKLTFQYLMSVNPFGILATNRSVANCMWILLFAGIVIACIPSNACFAEERQRTSTSRVTESEAEDVESVDAETSDSSLRTEATFEQFLFTRESNLSDHDCHFPHPEEESTESREPREPVPNIITMGFKDHYVERGGTWMRIVFSSATTCFPVAAIGEKYIGTKFDETELPDPNLPDKPIKVIVGPDNQANIERVEYSTCGPAKNHCILITGLKPNTTYHGLIFALDDKNSHGSLVWGSLVDALRPLEFRFSTRSRGTVIDFWKIHVIKDGDGFSKGEGELDFQMFAKYKIANQEVISETPRIHNDLSDGESWLIGCKAYILGAKTFQLFAGAWEEDGTWPGVLNRGGTGIFPVTDFSSDYHHDAASDGMTVNVADKWQVINDQVKEGYQTNRVIKVDGRPHGVDLAFDVHAKLQVMYWDMGLPWYSSAFFDTNL